MRKADALATADRVSMLRRGSFSVVPKGGTYYVLAGRPRGRVATYNNGRLTFDKSERRRHARRNPSDAVGTALRWLGGGAVIGAGLGVLGSADRTNGALNGATGGVALVGVGGLLVALFNRPARQAGFTAAGIGLGGLALLGLARGLVAPAATA